MTWRWLPYAGAAHVPPLPAAPEHGWELIRGLEHPLPAYTVVGAGGGMLLTAWLVHRLVERPVTRPLRRRLDKALGRRAVSLGTGCPGGVLRPSPRRTAVTALRAATRTGSQTGENGGA